MNLGNVVGLLKSVTAPIKKYILWASPFGGSADAFFIYSYNFLADTWQRFDIADGYALPSVVAAPSNTPPVSPVIGAYYLTDASSTGAWATFNNCLALWTGSDGWFFTGVKQGAVANHATDSSLAYQLIGGAWLTKSSSGRSNGIVEGCVIEKGSFGGVGGVGKFDVKVSKGLAATNTWFISPSEYSKLADTILLDIELCPLGSTFKFVDIIADNTGEITIVDGTPDTVAEHATIDPLTQVILGYILVSDSIVEEPSTVPAYTSLNNAYLAGQYIDVLSGLPVHFRGVTGIKGSQSSIDGWELFGDGSFNTKGAINTYSKIITAVNDADLSAANIIYLNGTGVTISTFAALTTPLSGYSSHAGATRVIYFNGVNTLVHSTALNLLSAANITTASGDVCVLSSTALGWSMISYSKATGSPLVGGSSGETAGSIGALLTLDTSPLDTDYAVSWDGTFLLKTTWTNIKAFFKTYFDTLYLKLSGGTLTGAINYAPSISLTGATPAIGAANSNNITITSTTTITAFDTIAEGVLRRVKFSAITTLTHSASLDLPTSANITTAVGDEAEFMSLGSGNWKCIRFTRKDGTALTAASTLSVALRINTSNSANAILGANGNGVLSFTDNPGAVNRIELVNSIVNGTLIVRANGSDSNIPIRFESKGTGSVFLRTNGADKLEVTTAGIIRGLSYTGSVERVATFLTDGSIASSYNITTNYHYAQRSANTASSNSTSEIAITTANDGAKTIVASENYVGKVIELNASGEYSSITTPTLTINVRFGSSATALASRTLLVTTGAIIMPAGATTLGFKIVIRTTYEAIGTSGTAKLNTMLEFRFDNGTLVQFVLPKESVIATGIDTTVDNVYEITAAWSVASTSNNIVTRSAILQKIK